MWVILVVVLQLPQLEVLQGPAGAVVAQDLEADVPFFWKKQEQTLIKDLRNRH